VEAKIRRSLQVLDWLRERYDIEREVEVTRHEGIRLGKAPTVAQIRTVEGRVALRYWETFAKVMPESLHFQGRMTTSHNNNASDCCNAALNYGYGFIKVLCRTAINSVGLEPAVGFLHETSSAQTAESLVYDLMEPFRFLADICVIQAFESGKLSPCDFVYTRNDYLFRIEWEGKMRLLDHLRKTFNSGVSYKGRVLKWDTVIEQKALELSRFLTRKSSSIDFIEPVPMFERKDNRETRETILSLTHSEAEGLGIGKSELHYLKRKAGTRQSFRLYRKVMDKINRIQVAHGTRPNP
jgi:CRISPR-associated protein Cas1